MDAPPAATVIDAVPPAPSATGEDLDLGVRVDLEAFSGPLDLLLFLVRRAEVDITTVAIAQIADQFLATVTAWEDMDLDLAGDFILMAATLLEIKARILMPPPEGDEQEEDEDDELLQPGSDLIRKLLAFRRFKDASLILTELETRHRLRHPRQLNETIPTPEDEDGVDLTEADPYRLFAAWEQIERILSGLKDRHVLVEDVPTEERIRMIMATMVEAGEGQLSWLLATCPNRVVQAGTFFAVLEAVRQRLLDVSQHEQFGPVYLRYLTEEFRRREAETHARSAAATTTQVDDAAEAPKRRRRRPPLFTYQIPTQTEEPVQEVLDLGEEEGPSETEEERFLHELNERTHIDALLDQQDRFDELLAAFLRERGLIAAAPIDTGSAPPPAPEPPPPESPAPEPPASS